MTSGRLLKQYQILKEWHTKIHGLQKEYLNQ